MEQRAGDCAFWSFFVVDLRIGRNMMARDEGHQSAGIRL
jgi:hypothetical protein